MKIDEKIRQVIIEKGMHNKNYSPERSIQILDAWEPGMLISELAIKIHVTPAAVYKKLVGIEKLLIKTEVFGEHVCHGEYLHFLMNIYRYSTDESFRRYAGNMKIESSQSLTMNRICDFEILEEKIREEEFESEHMDRDEVMLFDGGGYIDQIDLRPINRLYDPYFIPAYKFFDLVRFNEYGEPIFEYDYITKKRFNRYIIHNEELWNEFLNENRNIVRIFENSGSFFKNPIPAYLHIVIDPSVKWIPDKTFNKLIYHASKPGHYIVLEPTAWTCINVMPNLNHGTARYKNSSNIHYVDNLFNSPVNVLSGYLPGNLVCEVEINPCIPGWVKIKKELSREEVIDCLNYEWKKFTKSRKETK